MVKINYTSWLEKFFWPNPNDVINAKNFYLLYKSQKS